MKLVRHHEQFVLELGGREHRLLLEVLKLFPRIPPAYHCHHSSDDETQSAADARLLEEALAAQKAASRKQLDAWLKERQRMRASNGVWRLTMSQAEMNWFLQVLNDIRVGSWLRLGSPADPHGLELTRENWKDFMALEFCGFAQSVMLRGLDEPS